MNSLLLENLEPRTQSISNSEWQKKRISCSMLRLDELDKNISGNKIFKLYYFLQQAIQQKKGIVTFGGAWSNHLAATASACKRYGIACIGFVRGEQPQTITSTLHFCLKNDMQLKFVNRSLYNDIKSANDNTLFSIEDNVIIPEGGYSPVGAKGAAIIRNYFRNKEFTHVCVAIGTATTFAGLLNNNDECTYLGFTSLKNMTDIDTRIKFLTGNSNQLNYEIIKDYHFGGFAKHNDELIEFMNNFYLTYNIPLDFVYTGKMMYGVVNIINANYFPENSRILCIHTGGLHGNQGLPPNTFIF